MDYLPVFMNVRAQRCLLVGVGEVASRKAAILARAGAALVVVAPEVREDIRQLVAELDGSEIHQREFHPDDLEGVALVVAATADSNVNKQISALARERQLPV